MAVATVATREYQNYVNGRLVEPEGHKRLTVENPATGRIVSEVPDSSAEDAREAIEVAVRMAKLHTGAFEVASLTRSWHGLPGGAAALTMTGGRRGYGPTGVGRNRLRAGRAHSIARCSTIDQLSQASANVTIRTMMT